IVINSKGIIKEVNHHLLYMFGYQNKDNLIGENVTCLMPESFAQDHYKHLINFQSRKKEMAQGRVLFGKRQDGSEFQLEITLGVIEYNKVDIVGVIRNVHDREKEKNELIQAKKGMEESQSIARFGSWSWDASTGQISTSKIIYELFGLEASDNSYDNSFSYKKLIDSVHPDSMNIALSIFDKKNYSNLKPHTTEIKIIWPDKSIHWLLAYWRLSNNSPDSKKLTGVFQDITRAKEAEEHLNIFRNIIKSSNQGVAITDTEGNIIYCNKAKQKIFKMENDRLTNHNFKDLLVKDANETFKQIKNHLKQSNSWNGTLEVINGLGEPFPLMSDIGAIYDNNNELTHYFNIMSDYTEVLNKQNELENAKQLAVKSDNAKSEFLSSMSHELRTPLNAILGFSQLISFDASISESTKENSNEINKAGKHLLRLINDILDFSKIEAGKIELSIEAVSLEEIITECTKLLSSIALSNNISINLTKGDIAFYVRADRVRLKQALVNLITNAIKYNRDNGSVNISCLKENNNIKILINDTGFGLDKSEQKQLFKPFSRITSKYHQNIEGTGIGLVFTKKLIELMSGDIGVHSEINIGSTFWISLPQEKSKHIDIIESDISDSDKKSWTNDNDINRKNILYIEDNPANLKLVVKLLSLRKNIHLMTAHTPLLGLDLIKVNNFDLILLDINMPEMNGYEVLEKIKSNLTAAKVPVIAITANALSRDIRRGLESGFEAYLTKPIDIDKFYETVDKYLNSE
ncbi:MAG: PAS domain S-box protein, partial [Gammaproteobacteria bacterium]|nr:PAS domain S-box protein [Gammaproteobacteria bacterium]